MKKLLLLPLLIVTCFCFAQDAKPNKIGLIGDFVGVLQHGGMLEGFLLFTLYCEDIQREVVFNSGFGIKNPPKVSYGRFSDLIWDIYTFGVNNGKYVLRVKAKSVYQYSHMSDRTEIVWTPIKITLISTSSTLPK